MVKPISISADTRQIGLARRGGLARQIGRRTQFDRALGILGLGASSVQLVVQGGGTIVNGHRSISDLVIVAAQLSDILPLDCLQRRRYLRADTFWRSRAPIRAGRSDREGLR